MPYLDKLTRRGLNLLEPVALASIPALLVCQPALASGSIRDLPRRLSHATAIDDSKFRRQRMAAG